MDQRLRGTIKQEVKVKNGDIMRALLDNSGSVDFTSVKYSKCVGLMKNQIMAAQYMDLNQPALTGLNIHKTVLVKISLLSLQRFGVKC